MKKRNILLLFLLFPLVKEIQAQQKPALSWKDVSKWNSIKSFSNSLSPNGKWMGWVTGPTEGDLTVVIKNTTDTTKLTFPIGATTTSIQFSKDSRFAAFKVTGKDAEIKAAKTTGKPVYDKLMLVSLPGNVKTTFEKVQGFDFSNDAPQWIAIQFSAAESAPKGKDDPKGTDVLLYNLNTKKSFNIGNVAEYKFNKPGTYLAYTIDAAGQNGNGIFIRDLTTGITTALDNDKSVYKNLKWNEKGDAFALLKSNKNDKYKEEVYTVLGFNKINGDQTHKVTYAGIDQPRFPKTMGISGNSTPAWSDDQQILYFGISAQELADKKTDAKADSTATAKSTGKTDSIAKTVVKPDTTSGGKDNTKTAAKKNEAEKPEVTIWNWKDKRLQSAQLTQETRDKNFSFLSEWNTSTQQFIQLADSNMRNVNVPLKGTYAIGFDNSNYELMGNLDGQSYTDIYRIDLNTGAKKLIFEKFYNDGQSDLGVSPDGKMASYSFNGNYYTINLATLQKYNLTGNIKSSFIDELDDHNVMKPVTPTLGWTADSKYVLLKDNYDLWRVSADGKNVTALSDNWKLKKQEVQKRFSIYENEKGTDLSKNQYFNVFNTNDKKSGIGVLEAGKSSIKVLFIDNNAYNNFDKARDANVFVYSKENNQTAPEFYSTTATNLSIAKQVTKNTPDQEKYAWSTGVKLIKYLSANGDSLQAALYLPANYVEGKSYPTITYIYERLTDNLNAYTMPAFPGGGFNKSVYTSNGYAVLMPDIKYKLNDPGMSAVACVVPAVKAAIATGIVDEKRVAIHGHSWGGYQTSFLITQTNIFKAAAAGAPLTNMISMYSLIYWNSGGTNQAIFEASQGRLTPGYWDNWDAFARNSPVYHIKKVQTPLLLLHNDKDGAVDFTQGIEYYNGLRRLNKPVVMITYKGENHGIAKLPNRKDYAVRMMEYFDYMLKDKPAPDWWTKGINRLDMEKHLDTRAFEE